MFSSLSKITIVKTAVITGAVLLAAFCFTDLGLSGQKASASASGPSPSFTGAPYIEGCPGCPKENNCTACHSGTQPNSGPGNVVISGLPANYRPSQQIPLTVTVNDPEAVIYGFQMVAIRRSGENAGTLEIPAADPGQLQLVTGFVNGNERRYIEHTINGVTPTQFGSKSWTFNWTAPAERVGKIGFYAAGNGANSDGSSSGDNIYLSSAATLSGTAIANFDSDTKSDLSVYRPANGTWYFRTTSPPTFQQVQFGQAGDKPAPGDYDGDGRTDQALFRPAGGTWHIRYSTGGTNSFSFGVDGDIPVPGDYDGDGRFDLAVWRPSNGTWYFRGTTGIYRVRQFGALGDKPAQGDYDADGVTDFAVFRQSTGTWYLQLTKVPRYVVRSFGVAGDLPVQADYDGDGKTDIAVFRPSNGTWYRLNSSAGYYVFPFGQEGDRPAPADYDGDGLTDIAVFRGGTWYIFGSDGPTYRVTTFGEPGDVPVSSGYIAEYTDGSSS